MLLLISFGINLLNVAQNGTVDLRNRITGVRLLEHHLDPYHYQWQAQDPEEFLDPLKKADGDFTRTTITPALLVLHVPLAALPYRTTQFLWLGMQWLLLLGTFFLWFRRCEVEWQKWVLALFLVGFTYTSAWRAHAEIGQIYVLITFLFACWLATTLDFRGGNKFTTGLLMGLLVTLRPPFLLLFPFLLLHRRGQLPGAFVGMLVGFSLPLFFNPAIWMEYSADMHAQGAFLYATGAEVATVVQTSLASIEGVPLDFYTRQLPVSVADFSIFHFEKKVGLLLPLPVLLAILAVMFLIWLWLSRKRPFHQQLLGLAAWMYLSDLFLPAVRFTYHDVLILNVVGLGLIGSKKPTGLVCLCLLALPVGWYAALIQPPAYWVPNVATLCFVLGAVLALFPRLEAEVEAIAPVPIDKSSGKSG